MTTYEFAKTYATIFREEESLISGGRLRFPVTKDSVSNDEFDHCYHIDNINLEGFLDLKMPSIEESLQFTLKNFKGLQIEKGRSNDQSTR